MRESPLIHYVCLGIITHARAAEGVRGKRRSIACRFDDFNRACRAEPLFHFVDYESGGAGFILLRSASDAADGVAQRVLHFGIEIEERVLVRERVALQISGSP